MNDADAKQLCITRRRNLGAFSVPYDLSCIRFVVASQDLDQRRFARAILAQNCMDFAALQFEVYVIQYPHAGEDFG